MIPFVFLGIQPTFVKTIGMSTDALKTVGVVGSGSFGMAVANLLAYNTNVLVFTRKPETVTAINNDHFFFNTPLSEKVRATMDIEEVATSCKVIFPVVPSVNFRAMMQNLSPFLRPSHILIHGTKGFDITGIKDMDASNTVITRSNVHTMSEVILQESVVVRVGCMSGPNLSAEIISGQPTASVIGSRFKEVTTVGQQVLQSRKFHVFGTYEILGAELAGALKNIIAIASGILAGNGLGKNIQAMLINRGLTEMIHLGKAMGAISSEPFLGTAGIADLIATATSTNSRNFTFGYRIGQGEKMDEILRTMPEQPEGVRTLKIARHLSKSYKLHVPIIQMVYSVVFQGLDIEKAITFLMEYPYAIDVDFI